MSKALPKSGSALSLGEDSNGRLVAGSAPMTAGGDITVKHSILIMVAMATPCLGRAHKIDEKFASVDNQPFRLSLYDDGSVKVIERGIVGDAPSFKLRERMRVAVLQGTGCPIADDFWLDGKLVGRLACKGGAQ